MTVTAMAGTIRKFGGFFFINHSSFLRAFPEELPGRPPCLCSERPSCHTERCQWLPCLLSPGGILIVTGNGHILHRNLGGFPGAPGSGEGQTGKIKGILGFAWKTAVTKRQTKLGDEIAEELPGLSPMG